MKFHPFLSLCAGTAGIVLAGCGGGTTSPSSVVPVTSAIDRSATSASTDTRVATQALTTAIPSGTYFAGTVTGINVDGITANCGQSNFAQGYGCLPVITTGANVSGSPVIGQYFQMWGDLSKLPNITATTINYAPAAFPSTAPTTTAATATSAPSGMPAGAPAWTGVVSDVGSATTFSANCGQSNFAQGYGCLPVRITGTMVGALVKGTHFEMWGDVAHLPNVTATYIIFSSTGTFPTAAPAGAATSAPATAATPAPAQTAASNGSTFMGLANASDYPASFTPFASTSIWNSPVSTHPAYLANSAAIVAAQFPNGRNAEPVRANEAGQYDYNHPRFFASASDPLVTVHCYLYCGAPDNAGAPSQIRIPAVARPTGGGDHHLDVVQPDGTDITMFAVNSPAGNWSNGATLNAGSVANCGSFANGQGWLPSGGGPTAAGYCTNAGVVTAAELAAGTINHALLIIGECAVGSQYPVESGGSTQSCTSGVGPPLGGREWYDVPCATTQANGALRPWEKAILCALNVYGGYLGDNLGGGAHFTGGVNPQTESEEPWYDFNGPNYTSPFAQLASQGWNSISVPTGRGTNGRRWIGADPWQPSGVDFASHIHWLAPCSAQKSC